MSRKVVLSILIGIIILNIIPFSQDIFASSDDSSKAIFQPPVDKIIITKFFGFFADDNLDLIKLSNF